MNWEECEYQTKDRKERKEAKGNKIFKRGRKEGKGEEMVTMQVHVSGVWCDIVQKFNTCTIHRRVIIPTYAPSATTII